MSRRVRFAVEPQLTPENYHDAAVDTSDLLDPVASLANPAPFTLVQGTLPALNRPLSEHLNTLSLGSTHPRRMPVEAGPPDRCAVDVGPKEDDREMDQGNADERSSTYSSDSDDSSSSSSNSSHPYAPKSAPRPLPSVGVPFVWSRSCTAYVRNASWWYVVTIGKVVGVFCDRDFVIRVRAEGHPVAKFKEFEEARRYYNQQKQLQNLRILRSGNDDERLYGNIAYATM
ncbi:hypothetical protein BKA70DRAFT_1438047 [Coprinopsis sp. MPI-PUGE-AT-0042]|nr:hypothetical protein BKA70DRAFT_1438047 [Coprinopsis sp. MPI-PUGE-AT-0042]